MKIIKAAAVQMSPVLYSREGTVRKLLRKSLNLVAEVCSSRLFQRR